MIQVFPSEVFLRKWAVRILLAWGLVLFARTSWVSRDEHTRALAAERAGDVNVAIAHHRRAIRHAAPPFDRASDSIAALFRIADRAERDRNPALALSALRSIRGSIVSTRWLFSRRDAERTRADRGIARISAELDQSPSFRELGRAEVARRYLAELDSVPRERPFGILLATGSFIAFVYLARRLLTENVKLDDSWDEPAAKVTLARLAVAFVGFVVGLIVT